MKLNWHRSYWLVAVISVLVVALLAAIGYMVWQNHRLASEVTELRGILASTGQTTATTASDTWAEYDQAEYAQACSNFFGRRDKLIDRADSLAENGPKFELLESGFYDLLDSVASLPLAPAEVLDAQDAYFAALRVAYSRLRGFAPEVPDTEKLDAVLSAVAAEREALGSWQVVLKRFGVEP